MHRVSCPSCDATLVVTTAAVNVVVEEVRQTVKMGGWDPPPLLEDRPMDREPTLGELGLCGDPKAGGPGAPPSIKIEEIF